MNIAVDILMYRNWLKIIKKQKTIVVDATANIIFEKNFPSNTQQYLKNIIEFEKKYSYSVEYSDLKKNCQ